MCGIKTFSNKIQQTLLYADVLQNVHISLWYLLNCVFRYNIVVRIKFKHVKIWLQYLCAIHMELHQAFGYSWNAYWTEITLHQMLLSYFISTSDMKKTGQDSLCIVKIGLNRSAKRLLLSYIHLFYSANY